MRKKRAGLGTLAAAAALVLCFVLTGAACAGTEPPPSERSAAVLGESEFWTPTPTFTTQSGVLDGQPVVFHNVYVGAFTSDGGVVVAGTDMRLVFLDPSGNITRAFGRRGNGPGEFAVIDAILGTPEGIVVMDLRNRRVSTLRGPEVVSARAVPLPDDHRFVGVLSDGTIVTTFTSLWVSLRPPPVPEGTVRSYYLWSESSDTPLALSGGVEPAQPIVRYEVERDGRPMRVTSHLGDSCLPEWRHGVAGNRMFLADSQNGVLLVLDRFGNTEVLYEHPRDTITTELLRNVREMLERRRVDDPVPPQGERAYFERIGDVGDALPSAWSAMVVDPWEEQRIWLRRASCFEPDASEAWFVFDTRGRLEATVELPPKTRLLAAKGKRMLAVVSDDLGVESITVLEAR